MTTAGAALRGALHRAGDRPLLIENDRVTHTGRTLDAAVDAIAGALVAEGLRGARIGLWSWNSTQAVEAHLAVERVGGTRVPMDPSAPLDEARAVFEAAEVAVVLTDADHAGQLSGLALVHDRESPLQSKRAPERVEVEPDAIALLYPRMAVRGQLLAVPMSYANWQATMELNSAYYRTGVYGPSVGPDDCYVTVQQIMHGTGMLGTFPFLYLGLPQVILRRFDAGQFLEAVLRHAATTTFFVPGMITRVVDAMSGAATTPFPLRRLLYGGAPMPYDDLLTALHRLGPVLAQVYGRFEGGWPLTCLNQEDHQAILAGDRERATSCGRAVPGHELEIRPIPGRDDGTGELRVQGPMVVREYADPDGWCALGDLASRDAQGYVRLHGRLDGMINSGSYHVYPAEVEEAITGLLPVRAVRVVGEPDPEWGEVVTAYLVWEERPEMADTGALRERLGTRLAKYKIPKRFKAVSELPPAGVLTS